MLVLKALLLACSLLSLLPASLALSALADEGFKYPELLVVPRASQTLAKKAADENQSRFTTHLLLQAPAVLTLTAGLSAMGMKEDQSKDTGLFATGVGASWLMMTVFMSAAYTPYRSGLQEVSSMGKKSVEQTLAAERRAEEALQYPAYIMRRLQYISVLTQFGAGVAVAGLAEENESSKVLGGMAAAAALLPLIFSHPWIEAYDQQLEYKKRIYGPLSEVTLLLDNRTGRLVPGFSLRVWL